MVVKDHNTSTDALKIVQKYEDFVSYLYPILQRSPRIHGVLRDVVIAALFEPIGELYQAAKTGHVSKLYMVDAQFATLRSFLRFLANESIKIVSPRQHEFALGLLGQAGGMLNAWQKKLGGQSGKR
jgi:hypothetical protein